MWLILYSKVIKPTFGPGRDLDSRASCWLDPTWGMKVVAVATAAVWGPTVSAMQGPAVARMQGPMGAVEGLVMGAL